MLFNGLVFYLLDNNESFKLSENITIPIFFYQIDIIKQFIINLHFSNAIENAILKRVTDFWLGFFTN